MKLLALQFLALCGLAVLAAQPTLAAADEELFISTCDIECLGPFNACSWRALRRQTTKAECDSTHEKCLKDCVAKNGIQKYVYKPQPHPEANLTPSPAPPKYNNLRNN